MLRLQRKFNNRSSYRARVNKLEDLISYNSENFNSLTSVGNNLLTRVKRIILGSRRIEWLIFDGRKFVCGYSLLFSNAVWLHSMMAATAIPTLLNSMRPDDDRSDLRGNSLTVVGASIPRSTNTRCTVSSVKSGGVLKKWTIFEGGCILFLLAIAGFRNLKSRKQRIDPSIKPVNKFVYREFQ